MSMTKQSQKTPVYSSDVQIATPSDMNHCYYKLGGINEILILHFLLFHIRNLI